MPVGAVSRLPGDAAVDLAASAGLYLDEWQQYVLRESLGVRVDGKWAAFSSCVIVPRQNGKGAILEALALAGLFLFDCELIVWTAHEMKTAKEGFRRLIAHIQHTPDLQRKVAKIKHGNDDRGIELLDGRRIQFLARSSGSGRGFTGDLIILDEAYELDGDVMAALLPTLSAVPNPQIWYTSSAPMSTSEQLHNVRERGIAGTDSRLAYFEWSAAPGSEPMSEATWAQANPGYPHRISREAIEAEWAEFNAANDPSKFNRERNGFPDKLAGSGAGPISLARWAELADPTSSIVGEISTAIDVSPDLKWTTIACAGCRRDGHYHVEIGRRQPGTDWVLQFAKDNPEYGPYRVAGSSPAGFLLPLLAEAGVWAIDVPATEVTQATARLITAVDDGTIHHLGSNEIAAALSNATITQRGDAQSWSRIKSTGDISALVAATIAVGGMRSDDYEPQIRF